MGTAAPALGSSVTYKDSKGHTKLALVTGNADTVSDGTELPALEGQELHLFVISPSGSHYGRVRVKHESEVDLALAQTEFDAEKAIQVESIRLLLTEQVKVLELGEFEAGEFVNNKIKELEEALVFTGVGSWS